MPIVHRSGPKTREEKRVQAERRQAKYNNKVLATFEGIIETRGLMYAESWMHMNNLSPTQRERCFQYMVSLDL